MSKKENILDAALRLFTQKGVQTTSTKSIALEAHTSEALIFKHFGSKEKLLEEIIKKGYKEASTDIARYLEEPNPTTYLSKIIEMPGILVDTNPEFWSMQYKIIALNELSQQYHNKFMKPCYGKLIKVFSELHYKDPINETRLLLIILDGIWKSFAEKRTDTPTQKKLIDSIKSKYALT